MTQFRKTTMLRSVVSASVCLWLASCSSSTILQDTQDRFSAFEAEHVRTRESTDRIEPRSYESHFRKALEKFNSPTRTEADLKIARVGFETAGRLSRDFWPAYFYAGVTHDLLGNNEQAMASFAQAARINDNAALWNAAALSALRGGYERLAYSLHQRALTASQSEDDTVSEFMSRSYTAIDTGSYRPSTIINPEDMDASTDSIVCRAPAKDDEDDDEDSDDEDDDSDDNSSSIGSIDLDFSFADDPKEKENAATTAATTQQCDQKNILVDMFIIRRNGESGSTLGIDLLSALQIQFGAQLLDFTYTNPSGAGSSSSVSSAASISIPDVTYAVSLANDRQSIVTIDSSPTVMARVGETSEIFDGTEVYIVANGDGGSGQYEKEIGVKMTIEPTILTDEAATLKASLEFSMLDSNATPSINFQTLNTDKLIFHVNGTMPYGSAVVVGKLQSSVVKAANNGETGLRSVPFLKNLFGNENANTRLRDVLVLASVRQPGEAPQKKAATFFKEFGLTPSPKKITRYGYIHDAPSFTELATTLAPEKKLSSL